MLKLRIEVQPIEGHEGPNLQDTGEFSVSPSIVEMQGAIMSLAGQLLNKLTTKMIAPNPENIKAYVGYPELYPPEKTAATFNNPVANSKVNLVHGMSQIILTSGRFSHEVLEYTPD